MKVYIVTYGEYSEYTIAAVFSTREQADEYVQYHGTRYRVEEFDADQPFDKKEQVWHVAIDTKEGIIKDAYPNSYSDCYASKLDTCQIAGFGDNELCMYLMCDTKERAKKIARERLAALKSNPVIWERLNTKLNTSDGLFVPDEYPVFNIITNKFYSKVPRKIESPTIEGFLERLERLKQQKTSMSKDE